MAAVLDQKDAAAKNGSQVDEQIAQATSRIRAHDLAFGGLVLLALVLAYTTAMIVLDRYLNLPAWVRGAALAGFGVALAAAAYLTLFSPLRRRINPLYAAKQVERTLDDPKNSVTGYVDAQEKGNLNPTVKAALASRAAKAAAEADVNRAVDHRSLLYLGGVSVAFVLTLVVLFFVFRPAQFSSLVGRTFVPFSSGDIVGQTQLTLTKPDPAEPTITTGQSITVGVYVAGKVPKADAPDRVRLLVRHNPADPNYDELPMVPAQGATNRDWELRVPDYLVQNGFWYKVAAGDAVTPEYKVTVRSLPLFTDFQTTYEYPKYLRRKPETTTDPVVRAYRGTTVTLVAKTNREVRDGLMVIEPGNGRTAGVPVAGRPDSLQFVFKVTESGKYKLTFTAANGERSADPFAAVVTAETDAAPIVTVNKPEEDETAEPANGLLKVDGKVGDDFGIDTVTLKMRIVGAAEQQLPDVPYLNGKSKSFRREKDDTWPTDLDYKGSVDLAKIKTNAAGLPLVNGLAPDTVIEYWLEATDNCTEPKPNVGRSAPKRVRLTPPKTEEPDQKQLDKQKEARQNEEKKHADQQKQQLDKEPREPKKDGQPQPGKQDNRGDKGDGDKNPDGKPEGKPDAKQPAGDKGNDKGDNTPKNPPEPTKGDNKSNMGEKSDPMQKGSPDGPPMNPMNPMGMGMPPDTAPPPSTPEQRNIDKTAEDFKQELEKQSRDGGGSKPDNAPKEEDRTDAGAAKPQQPPMGMDGKDGAAETKPEPKGPSKNDPANEGGKGGSSETKPQGDLKKPEEPSAPKPEQPKNADPMGGQKNGATSERKDEPFGAPPGTDKDPPKEPQPAPKDPNRKQEQDPNSRAKGKPAGEKKDGAGAGNASDKKDPADNAGAPKPSPETTRGGDKPPAQPKKPADTKPQGDPDAGDAKPDAAPRAGDAKPMPKEGPMPMGADPETKPKPPEGSDDPKNPKGGGSASEVKPDDPMKAPMGGGKPVDKGTDKPEPRNDKGAPGAAVGGGDNTPKQKLDEKQLKELQDAAKNLTNPDPQKKKDARDKLDRAVGEEKRKELEKLANDVNSPDEKTREEARRKLEAMKEQMKDGKAAGGKEPDKKDGGAKLDEKQKKEIADAIKDLQSTDDVKKKAAQEKLDKTVGEKNRKEAEDLLKDLNSDDKTRKEAAEKKLQDLKKEFDKLAKDGKDGGNGKEPSPEEIAELAKKAQDLQSKDQKTREQAEKDLDDKIGKENREKLQKELQDKKLDPKEAEQLKKELEQMAKNNPSKKPEDDVTPKGLGSGTQAKGPMEEDAKNRLKSAELLLEQLENETNRKALQAKQGWTEAEYDKFLDGYRRRIDQIREEAKNGTAAGDKPPVSGPTDTAAGPLKGVTSGKVEARPGMSGGREGVGGPSAAPPGFEDARRKFEEALKKKP